MKNWKRFIAACLSVTMIASTPLTAFAESSVSAEQLMLQNNKEVQTPKEEKAQETEFEKILTNKTPYEYFAKLEKQQNILDTLKDEELFQLKELMKYAYVHESSSENRQSLDAYMLILEAWKKRDIQYEEKAEEALVQEAIEKSAVYETVYDKEKKVIDASSYLEYLSTIKKIDVPKYMKLLTSLEQAKTDEDLEKAKSAFRDFEEQVYGFKEQVENNSKTPNEEKTPEKEKPSNKEELDKEKPKQEASKEEKTSEEKAVDKLLEDGQYIKVYYLIYDGEEENVFSNFVVHSPYEILEDGTLRAVINAKPEIFDYNNGGEIPIDVDINRGMHDGMQIPITEQCVYNEEKGYVDIPAEHAKKDLTVTVWQSRESEFYKGLTDEVKPQEDRTGISTYGIFNDFFPSGTIPKDFAPKGCNVIELSASIDSVSVGQQWNATGTTWYIANRYNDDSYIWSDVAGAYQYDADFSQGQIINITSCDNPIFNNIGGAGPEGKNWIFTGCLSSVNNTFAGVPVITDMDIECIAKDGDYATFFMRARCKSPKGKAAQTVGGFFKAKMKNTYTMTYDGNGGLYGSNTTWSEEVVYKTDYTIWDNFFTRPGYTFTGWNTRPDGSGDDWTPYIGKPWNWWYTWDVTLYAQWKPNVLTIDYYSNGGVWTGMNSENSVAGKNQYITSYDYPYDRVDSHWNYSSLGLTKEGHDNTGYWGTTTTGGKLVHEDESLTGKQMAEKYGLDLSTGSKNLIVYAQWTPKNVSNTIGHYLWGFKNGEGPDGNGSSFHIKNTNFDAKYNSSFVMDSSRNIDIPNGYRSNGKFGTSAIDGSWKTYPLGTKVTQTSNSMFFEYDYNPIDYNITYHLDGGTNNSSNPMSYNVLYGKTLNKPTKAGYVFKGWEENLFADARVVPEEGSSKSGTTHTFVNTTSGNKFGNSKLQIWDRDYKNFLSEPINGTNGKAEAKYTHNLETGTYAIRFGANGSTDDSCSHLMNVYFEKGKTYTISYDSSVTSSKVVMSNIKILDSNVTGINAGKNATFSSVDQLYAELAKRKVENVTLTAKWEPITYTIKYDGNGATSGSTASSKHVYNVAKNLTANGFSKTGYTFAGWNTKPDGSGTAYADKQSVKNLTTTNSAVINLYAQWKPNTYTIKYDGSGATSGSTASSTHTYDEAKKLTPNGFHKDGYIFEGWNTKPDGSGTSYKDQEEVKNLTDVNKSTVILYAKWKPITYHIHYKGNGSLSGKDKTDTIIQKEITDNGGYTVKGNKGYTDFALTKNTFKGWYSSSVVNTQEEMKKIYKTGSKLSLEVLQKIHEEQLKNHIVTDKGATVKDVVLYAVWDKAPEITIPSNFNDEFYEGTTVTRTDLLKGIAASDKIDGDLSKQIIITQIDYSAGRLNGSGKDKAYSQKWANGMPADAVLDTWFMKLDKNDSPVKHKITYQVKDSAGNVTTATKEVRVIYNEFPEIKAINQEYTLEKAQRGVITEDALLKNLIAAGTLSASDKEEGNLSAKLELVDFDPSVFTSMKKEGFVPVTYRVQDSMGPNGKGKETLKTVYVYITAVRPGEDVKYVRFINKEYYEKNANLPLSNLTEQEIALYAVNGGLHPRSKWYSDPSYASVIKATFNKTSGDVYTYTKDDIEKMRDFVKTHGVGNAKETDGLNKFADTFMTGKYKK